MDYNLPPPESLRHRALIAEAFAIFIQHPVKDEILRLFKHNSWRDFGNRWKEIEETVKKRVEELELPQTLKQEVLDISKQIGLEILEWAKYYGQYYSESAFLDNLCWISEGAIDTEKTARQLVNDKSLSVLKRYKLACIYCFEDRIHDLHKQLNERIFNKEYLNKMRRPKQNSLVTFWSYYIHGRVNEIINDIPGSSVYEYGLKRAIDQGNSIAAKYFWEKLTPEEKEKNLERCVITAARKSLTGGSGRDRDPISFPKSCYTNILCFLLNQMSEEKQMKVFTLTVEILTFNGVGYSTLGYSILRGLLHFPYQQLFIPTAERAWNFLQEEKHYDLLLFIAQKIPNYPQSYRELLKYVWQKMPDKESAINIWEIREALSELCKIEDNRSIGLILNSSSILAKEQFVFSYKGRGICHNLIRQDKWKTLEFLIKHCLTSKDVTLRFKKEEKISPHLLREERQDHAAKFNEFLNDFITSFDSCTKRKGEDYDNKGKEMKSEDNQVKIDAELRAKRKERKDNDDFMSISKKIKTDLEVTKVSLNNIGLGKIC